MPDISPKVKVFREVDAERRATAIGNEGSPARVFGGAAESRLKIRPAYGLSLVENVNGVPPEECNRGHGGSEHDLAYGFLVGKKWNGVPPAWPVERRSESPGALGGLPPAAAGAMSGEGPGETNIECDRKSDEMGRM